MKRLVLGTFVAAVMFGTGLAVLTAGGGDNGKKVTICHFGGHDGDFLLTGFQVAKEESCRGGNEITIACVAAENGHNVAQACKPEEDATQ